MQVATLGEGRYELDEVLGRGGLAVTRRAVDRRLGRWVAVKSLVPDPAPDVAAAQRSRFVREARALARFDHPGIVRVYEVFEEGGTAHLVMELLAGRSVAAEVQARGGPLLAAEVEALASGLGRALATVHAGGLLHRDVSPSNVILVDDRRGGRRPVLVDFGLARAAGDATDAFTRMVTPGFAPPEQYGGDATRIGPATDVYGLAATLYHAATARLPASAVDRQHGAAVEPLRRLRPDLPRPFCDGVHDGLELDPAHRPPSVEAFLRRLGVDAPTPTTGSGEATGSPAPAFAGPGLPVPDAATAASARTASTGSRDPVFAGPGLPVASPLPVGGRGAAAVAPLLLLAVAAGVALPVVAPAVASLVVLPVLATVGDRLRGRRRLALPWRLARHVGAGAAAGGPAVLLGAAGSTAAWLLDNAEPGSGAGEVVAGIAGAAAVLVAVHRGGPDADAVTAWSRRCRDGLLYGAWAAALLALAGALALRPDLWPLPPS